MEVQIRDTIITDEYTEMKKTDSFKKIAQEVAKSPSGIVIFTEKKGKVMGVVTYQEIISSLLGKKEISKLKLKDILKTNILEVKETDSIEKVIRRIRRRKPEATVVIDENGKLVGYFSESDLSYAKACQQLIHQILK